MRLVSQRSPKGVTLVIVGARFFKGWMSLLIPNQQSQSKEGLVQNNICEQ